MDRVYKVEGMTCNGCKASVEKSLLKIDGINNLEVSLENAEASISSSVEIPLKSLQKALLEKFTISKKNDEVISIEKKKVSTIRKLYPLFLIFFFITSASILLSINPWNTSDFMLNFMGLFYIVFSFFKFLDVKGFAYSFKMYDPLAKKIKGYGFVYPFIELTLGLLFLYRYQVEIALLVTIGILGITTVGVIKSLVSKQSIKCACLGSVLNLPMTKATFIENSIMIVMALIMLVQSI